MGASRRCAVNPVPPHDAVSLPEKHGAGRRQRGDLLDRWLALLERAEPLPAATPGSIIPVLGQVASVCAFVRRKAVRLRKRVSVRRPHALERVRRGHVLRRLRLVTCGCCSHAVHECSARSADRKLTLDTPHGSGQGTDQVARYAGIVAVSSDRQEVPT